MAKKKMAVTTGSEAFENGTPFDDCPHPIGSSDRFWWFAGWLDAWSEKRVSEIRKRLNLGADRDANLDHSQDQPKRQ